MVFKDLIKYARARAEIAQHQNKSHTEQDLQIESCHVISLFVVYKKQP